MKTTTIDEFAQSFIKFAKTIVVAELFFIDKRVMVWYLIAYFSECASCAACSVFCAGVVWPSLDCFLANMRLACLGPQFSFSPCLAHAMSEIAM